MKIFFAFACARDGSYRGLVLTRWLEEGNCQQRNAIQDYITLRWRNGQRGLSARYDAPSETACLQPLNTSIRDTLVWLPPTPKKDPPSRCRGREYGSSVVRTDRHGPVPTRLRRDPALLSGRNNTGGADEKDYAGKNKDQKPPPPPNAAVLTTRLSTPSANHAHVERIESTERHARSELCVDPTPPSHTSASTTKWKSRGEFLGSPLSSRDPNTATPVYPSVWWAFVQQQSDAGTQPPTKHKASPTSRLPPRPNRTGKH